MGTTKYTYKLSDMQLRVLNAASQFEDVEGLTKFTIPDVEAGTEEISGQSGLLGTLELVDWANVGALEFGLTFVGIPENGNLLIAPGVRDIKLYWAEKYAQKDGTEGWDSYFVEVKGKLKKIPGGDGEKGSNRENELTYSAFYYHYKKNGKTIFEYDPANSIIKFYDKNYADDLKAALMIENA